MRLFARLWLWAAWRSGLRRLRYGFCPSCNSSPPWKGCSICGGSYVYGYQLSAGIKEKWRVRWNARFGR